MEERYMLDARTNSVPRARLQAKNDPAETLACGTARRPPLALVWHSGVVAALLPASGAGWHLAPAPFCNRTRPGVYIPEYPGG